MPKRPGKPCSKPGCPNKALPGKSRCEQHQTTQQSKEVQREYDKQRATSSQRGYGANWQKLRRMVLNNEPLCRRCKEKENKLTSAKEVHHIDNDSSNNALDNLMPLCSRCHSTITNKERAEKPAREGT